MEKIVEQYMGYTLETIERGEGSGVYRTFAYKSGEFVYGSISDELHSKTSSVNKVKYKIDHNLQPGNPVPNSVKL